MKGKKGFIGQSGFFICLFACLLWIWYLLLLCKHSWKVASVLLNAHEQNFLFIKECGKWHNGIWSGQVLFPVLPYGLSQEFDRENFEYLLSCELLSPGSLRSVQLTPCGPLLCWTCRFPVILWCSHGVKAFVFVLGVRGWYRGRMWKKKVEIPCRIE